MDEMATRIPLGSGKVGITEVYISQAAPAAKKKIWELDLPRDTIIGCILRGEESMIPRGDSRIFPGDTLVTVSYTHLKIQYDKGAGKRFCFPARSFDLACN